MAGIENHKVVEINRLSPCSMEYYVSILEVFGHRGLYHFTKKTDAQKFAKLLRKHIEDLFDKAPENEQKMAIELLENYTYKDINDYKHLIDKHKSDIYLEYV